MTQYAGISQLHSENNNHFRPFSAHTPIHTSSLGVPSESNSSWSASRRPYSASTSSWWSSFSKPFVLSVEPCDEPMPDGCWSKSTSKSLRSIWCWFYTKRARVIHLSQNIITISRSTFVCSCSCVSMPDDRCKLLSASENSIRACRLIIELNDSLRCRVLFRSSLFRSI